MIGWQLHPRVWAVLAVAVVLEGLTLVGLVPPMTTIDFIELPWSLPLVVVVLPFLRQSPPTFRRLTAAVTSALLLLVVLGAAFASASMSSGAIFAVVMTAVLEEAIFRLALPGLLAMILVWAGLRPTAALVVALVVAAGTFATMPGHLAQIEAPQMISIFFAFAILMTYVVWRGRFLWPAMLTHAAVDFFTLAYLDGVLSALQRVLGILACLLAMVFLTVSRTNRRQLVSDSTDGDGVIIDLREAPDARLPAALTK